MRPRTVTLACIAFVAVAAAGCATMSVGSYVERGTDFSRYQTYAWAPRDALPIGDPRLDNNPIFIDHLLGAVERELHKHQLLLVPESARPDLLIHFHGSVRQVLDVAGADAVNGIDVERHVSVVDYDEGTLILDMVDARTNRLVWRGWAVEPLAGILESQDRMERKIQQAVTGMLAQFKPL
jgi:hypothetical protein